MITGEKDENMVNINTNLYSSIYKYRKEWKEWQPGKLLLFSVTSIRFHAQGRFNGVNCHIPSFPLKLLKTEKKVTLT